MVGNLVLRVEACIGWVAVYYDIIVLAGPVQIAQLCHLYSVENLLEHNT